MPGPLNPRKQPDRAGGPHGWSPVAVHRSSAGATAQRPLRNTGALLVVTVLFVLPIAGSLPATNSNEVARIELAVAAAHWARLDIGPVATPSP